MLEALGGVGGVLHRAGGEQYILWPTPPILDTLFQPLPSGRRLLSIRTKTSPHKNSLFLSATGLINKA